MLSLPPKNAPVSLAARFRSRMEKTVGGALDIAESCTAFALECQWRIYSASFCIVTASSQVLTDSCAGLDAHLRFSLHPHLLFLRDYQTQISLLCHNRRVGNACLAGGHFFLHCGVMFCGARLALRLETPMVLHISSGTHLVRCCGKNISAGPVPSTHR